MPYIPGSSLKGKMRSLIELAYGETDNGDVTKDPNTKAGKLFGVASEININNGHPSRIIVRDGKLKILKNLTTPTCCTLKVKPK